MKPLILHIAYDKSAARNRIPRLFSQCNITSVGPEQAIFTAIDAQFEAVIVCHSVPKRKALTLVQFLRRVAPQVPVIMVRTGRERQPLVPADYYVMQMEEHLLLPRLVEQLTDHSAMHLPRRVVTMETVPRHSVAAKQAS
jgi:PHD/YefM family antitoxin component YafN of YafNO toxin-antitoxin module